nr:DinB family protein [Thermoanaerobaculales bacterium]
MSDLLAERLRACWARSDEIFGLLEPEALHEQPIALRHPLVFYLGHLPAFAWNQVCRGLLGRPGFRPDFDALFERGIDPVGVDVYQPATAWPAVEEVLEYRDRVRAELLDAVAPVAERAAADPLAARGCIFEVVIEHELMHQETLQYLLQQLPFEHKRRPAALPPYRFEGAAEPGRVEVGGGRAVLGAELEAVPFGWDNEFPRLELEVAGFAIDRTPVRNAEYAAFVDDGGYRRPELWRDEDWRWRQRVGLELPVVWSRAEGALAYRTLFDLLPLER